MEKKNYNIFFILLLKIFLFSSFTWLPDVYAIDTYVIFDTLERGSRDKKVDLLRELCRSPEKNDPEVQNKLADLIFSDTDPGIQSLAANVLKESSTIVSEEVAGKIIRIAENPNNPEQVRYSAITSLFDYERCTKLAPFYLKIFNDEKIDKEEKALAIVLLGRTGPLYFDFIERTIYDPSIDLEIKQSAIHALMIIGVPNGGISYAKPEITFSLPNVITALERILRNEDIDVKLRWTAVRALCNTKHEMALNVLREFYYNPTGLPSLLSEEISYSYSELVNYLERRKERLMSEADPVEHFVKKNENVEAFIKHIKEIFPKGIRGDFNNDGMVNKDDLIMLENGLKLSKEMVFLIKKNKEAKIKKVLYEEGFMPESALTGGVLGASFSKLKLNMANSIEPIILAEAKKLWEEKARNAAFADLTDTNQRDKQNRRFNFDEKDIQEMGKLVLSWNEVLNELDKIEEINLNLIKKKTEELQKKGNLQSKRGEEYGILMKERENKDFQSLNYPWASVLGEVYSD